jgi:hypothetical protein
MTAAAGRYRSTVRVKRETIVRVVYAGTAGCEPGPFAAPRDRCT